MSKLKTLSSMFRSAVKETKTTATTTLKQPSPTSKALNTSSSSIIKLDDSDPDSEYRTRHVCNEIMAVLRGDAAADSRGIKDDNSSKASLKIPWVSSLSQKKANLLRKEQSRTRKQKWIFKSTMPNRINRLIGMCAHNLGTEAMIDVLGKLGRETGQKECSAFIQICVDEARRTNHEDVALEQISKAFQILTYMKEQGFQLEEETYCPVLTYLIDMCMLEEFHFFCKAIKECTPSSIPRLGYYEMLFYIRVDDEEMIEELCRCISVNRRPETMDLHANYLLALCEREQKDKFLQLLEAIEITKVSTFDSVCSIFKFLGRLSLDPFAEKFLLALKNSAANCEAERISTLIYNYATSTPNLAAEDVILKFNNTHTDLEITPSTQLYEKLILYCCNLSEVHVALDVVDLMCKAGLSLSIGTLNHILLACETSYEFDLVRRIYQMICQHGLQTNHDTFRSIINLSAKMKDFHGAYAILDDLTRFNLSPTVGMYNALILGYFREKNKKGALMVLRQMERAAVKPDSETYGYLIANCENEDEVVKYYDELKLAGVEVSKHIYMALVNAFATSGQFEKAKEVLLDLDIPTRNLNEIKNVLVSALVSNGQISDALNIYEEIEQAGGHVAPKTVLTLIEHFQSEGELSRILKLLERLEDSNHWVDGCFRAILYCIRNKYLSSTVNLFKQLKNSICNDEVAMESIFDEAFAMVAGLEPTHLQFGLDLLQAIKDEFGVFPSRKCLDFMLNACIKAKNLQSSILIWKEYQAAGMPYNVLSYLRMYQAVLVSGDHKSAKVLLTKIPKDDPHIGIILKKFKEIYPSSTFEKGLEKEKKKEKKQKKNNRKEMKKQKKNNRKEMKKNKA
ncbi:hypothetical protein K2173_010752 [Erythroxylum novogranatense]|uniref:PROP1-like PPR domain-containing protein n=1 Tax=Erythroxylum novogranatense TaxID=1862640 RepID=A0AAV8SQV8_9ROSI|nr:hypothetical protein K2173_010752 [Erythroxylum novogranatense]